MSSLMILLVFISIQSLSQISYAQSDDVYTSEQITLSEDLTNNPLAQDILRKIEQTKKWIENLEKRNYEQLEEQKELEEKRKQALVKLEQDLRDWEKLWEYYSPKNSYERFVNKIPDSQVQEVFWDQFEFKEQKVKAGRDALKKVIADGGSLQSARQAYLIAAETKRIELIEANSQFNVNHNLAYYNQQILFDRQGQFVDSPITGEQLRQYYEDFRTNPSYLKANPNDIVSWDELGRTNSDTECRDEYVIIYRFHANDYVCVTMSTAELWIRHGMGEITGDSVQIDPDDQQSVSPLTRCDDGFRVIFNVKTEKYSCVLETTADEWVSQGIAEFPNPEEYIMQSIEKKETTLLIDEINQEMSDIQNELDDEMVSLKKKYDILYDQVLENSKEAEQMIIQDYRDDSDMSKDELSKKILSIRNHFESEKEDVLKDKTRDIHNLEKEYERKMIKFAQNYDADPYVMVVLNSANSGYEAVARE